MYGGEYQPTYFTREAPHGSAKTEASVDSQSPAANLPAAAQPQEPRMNGMPVKPHICKWVHSAYGMPDHLCHATFNTLEDILEHISNDHVSKDVLGRFVCCWEGCSRNGKELKAQYKLVNHLLIHIKGNSFVCSVCSKAFVRSENLKIHERLHTDLKPKQQYNDHSEDDDEESLNQLETYYQHLLILIGRRRRALQRNRTKGANATNESDEENIPHDLHDSSA